MSVTTSTNTVSQTVLHLLADYELHHSGDFVEPGIVEGQNSRPESRSSNTEGWPTNHRRIPDRRPIDRNLDRDLRPAGSFFMETCFIWTMLGGVTINSVSNPCSACGQNHFCHLCLRCVFSARKYTLAQYWRENQ
jgi:hypothetical protein